MQTIPFRTEIFQEGDQFVAIACELNVSSFGDTPEEAKTSLLEAVTLFLEECENMGTLREVLEEAGYRLETDHFVSNKPVLSTELSVTV